jgi:thioredoxin 1
MALEITDVNLDKLLQSEKPLVIDFWAEWCGPCRLLTPLIEELSVEYADRVSIGKLDVDSNPETCTKYGIRNIPTVLFIKNGEIVDKQIGAVPKNILVDKINALL